jgi:hypothetical protein
LNVFFVCTGISFELFLHLPLIIRMFMKDQLMKPVILLMRYWWVILLAVIIGNIIAWKQYKNAIPVYEYSFKVNVRGQYYDRARTLFEKIADAENWKNKNILDLPEKNLSRLHDISMNSYRNEDIYIQEVRFAFSDSTDFISTVDSLISYFHRDKFFKERYFDKVEFIDRTIRQYDPLTQALKKSASDSSHNALTAQVNMFDLNYKRIIMLQYKENQIKELEYKEPVESEMHFVPVNKFRPHVVATILFLFIGTFLAIFANQLQKKN